MVPIKVTFYFLSTCMPLLSLKFLFNDISLNTFKVAQKKNTEIAIKIVLCSKLLML